MWIDVPNPMIPPLRGIPVPPREIAWVIFKNGFFRWIPGDRLAALLIAAIPALLVVALAFFAAREVKHDQPLLGG